jgi:HSP20 family protein
MAGHEGTTEMAMYFDPFRDLDRFTAGLFGGRQGLRAVPMDLHKESDHYILDADLPGVDPGSIDIEVDGQLLTIRAQRTLRGQDRQGGQDRQDSSDRQSNLDRQDRPERQDGMNWLTQERPAGSFMRQLNLGDGIDADRITANYENGVLSVTIPVSEKAKPRRVEVGSASAQKAAIPIEQQRAAY